MVITFIAAALLGVFIGILSGLLGVGGGTIMVPMYRLAFGMSALASTATSLFTIIPTSISGVITHVRNKTCVPKLGIAMGLGGACTSPLGVWLASISPSWAVMVAAAIVIGYSAFNMVKKVLKAPRETPAPASAPAPGEPTASAPAPGETPAPASADASAISQSISSKQLVIGVLIGLVTGVASGYVGLGGGFLMVPLMLAWIGMPMKLASGTSLIGIMLIAIPGAISQGLLGNIDYLAGIATAIGTIPGALVGARFVTRVPERTLRILFSIFLGIGAVLLVVKEVALFV
ncbi:MAG: sulfite exporter TauE/SafE family protein [Eggerthellaceae bacterium]|nr:sulfite exporter TauE/SafE family protein [Eggerthellaceae bacterium]